MPREQLSQTQAVCVILVMIVSNNVILGLPLNVERDTWISLVLSLALVLPLMIMYARMCKLMPGRDFFEMLDFTWGKKWGRVLALLTTWYPLHLAALVLRNFSEFVHITSLPRTPLLIVMIAITLPCLYLARAGISILGRWMGVMIPITLFTIVAISAASYSVMDAENLLPVMEHSLKDIAIGAAKLVPYPFGECCMVMALSGSFKKESSPYKIFIWGALISFFILLIIFLRCLLVLGIKPLDTMYFPTYRAASIIRAGAFLERIESLISFMYILAGVTKAAICIIAIARGLAHAFRLPDYRKSTAPASILAMTLCAILFNNTTEMFSFIYSYQYYAVFFQILCPLSIWATAEIRCLRLRRANAHPAQQPA